MQHVPLSQELAQIMDEDSAASGLTLNRILERTEGRGIFVVMILLCLPFAPLFSIPGSSTLLGAVIMVLAIRHALGKSPRLPKRMGDRQLKPKTRKAILVGGMKILRVLEKAVRPRRTSWMSWRAATVVNSMVITWMAFLLALPLAIPFTNTTPAYAIIFLAASMMEEDGVLIWVGHAAALGTTIYFLFCAELIVNHLHDWSHTLAHWVRFPHVKYRWSIAPAQPALAGLLAQTLKISPLLAQCLLNRGLSEPEPITRFLQPRLKNLADPFLLPNMRAAVNRLLIARARAEPLVIFGDYDVDGVTATTLLTEVLTALGWEVRHYLPHRMDEGYGLSQAGVENCHKKYSATLLLAVDCGSTAVDSIRWLKAQGADVIVLDHHQVSNPAPEAVALVNPQLRAATARWPGAPTESPSLPEPDGSSNFTELCSAGLAFKLAHALVKQARLLGLPAALEFDLKPLLDLVALGTIADLVPLTGENRILVTAGLERLNATQRPGLLALRAVAGISRPIGAYEVGYQLGPRLNAAGRLETAEEALNLLLSRSQAEAEPLAQNLDARNRERQQIERTMTDQVIGAVRARFNPETDYVIVEAQLFWHIGVVGIVASRVLQEFYRPAIILGGEPHEYRGSGRSIEGFDLADALRACQDLLLRHGGHAMAAGLALHPDNLEAFRTRLNDLARRTLRPEQLQPVQKIDSEVKLADVTLERLLELAKLEHTGLGNPPVRLFARGVTHQRPPERIGAERRHARMWITDGRAVCPAVLWGVGQGALPSGRFDLAFSPQINEFKGTISVQLKVLDWREPQD